MVALSRTDFAAEDVARILDEADPALLGLSLLSLSGGFYFLALRWRALLPTDQAVSAPALAGVLVVGKLLNYAVPGPVGELAAALLAARRTGVSAEAAFAASVHGRVIGVLCAGIVALGVFVVFPLPVADWLRPWVRMASLAACGAAVALALLSREPRIVARIADLIFGRIRALRALQASAHRFAEALGHVGRIGLRRYLAAVGWALVAHTFVITGTGIACLGFGADPDLPGLIFTNAMATAGAIVLFTLPGAQAGWDAAFLLLLVSTAGLDEAAAAAVTMFVQLHQILLVLLGALVLLRIPRDGSAASQG